MADSLPPPALSESAAAAAIHARFPQLKELPVVRLGEGTDHQAFEVGGRYVFRFPRTSEAAGALAVEARLTSWLAPHLPLAVPAYSFVGEGGEGLPRAFAAYAKLAGTPALLVVPERQDLTAIARVLGDFLRSLHGLDVDIAGALGVPVEDPPTLEAWSSAALEELRMARERGHLGAEEHARWEQVLATPPSTRGAPRRVLHADFAAEHVLLDTHGVPTGVIDWSDAVVGDPARDVAGLLHWGGEHMLASALQTYGAVDAATLARARWFAACRAVADIAFGEERRRPEYVAAGQRALAWLR